MDTTNHLENQPRDKLLGELKKAGKDYEDAHFHNLLLLKKYGPNLFEDDGSIVTFCYGKEYRRPGQTFILNTIMHFESKYEPAWYKACAKLKRVLDCYDEKFINKKSQENSCDFLFTSSVSLRHILSSGKSIFVLPIISSI